jgi:hypothetical protein
MLTTNMKAVETVQELIGAEARSPEIPEEHDVYGWLVGSWDLEVRVYWAQDVSAKNLSAEAHFAWALEGRAIQDVWIMPPVDRRRSKLDPQMNMYGTTLRVWDATLKAWRITWLNPAGQHFEQQIGRRVGSEIVQLGTRPDGTTTRWRFTEITPDSFRWLGESLRLEVETWTLEGEFRARRISGASRLRQGYDEA